MQSILEKLFAAADNHGEDDEPDHTVGDLQDLLRTAWSIMTVGQKLQLLGSDEVENIVELGARGEFEADDLVAEVASNLVAMESAVTKAGYEFVGTNGRFYWKLVPRACGEDFHAHEDAVADAYRHHQAAQAEAGK